MNVPSHAFEVEQVRRRLEAGNGGYEVVHASPGLEVGVYVLVAPEPDTSLLCKDVLQDQLWRRLETQARAAPRKTSRLNSERVSGDVRERHL